MAKSSTSFNPGKSGNPAGRPPSGAAYTEILRRAGNQTVEYNGRRIARKRLLADYLWQVVIHRRVEFPDGSVIVPDTGDWLDAIWRVLAQVDGLPTQNMDVTSAGQQLAQTVLEVIPIDYRTAVAGLAPRSVEDSAAPSESESPFDGPALG